MINIRYEETVCSSCNSDSVSRSVYELSTDRYLVDTRCMLCKDIILRPYEVKIIHQKGPSSSVRDTLVF